MNKPTEIKYPLDENGEPYFAATHVKAIQGLEDFDNGEDIENLQQIITSLNITISTLQTDIQTLNTNYEQALLDIEQNKTDIETLKQKVEALKNDSTIPPEEDKECY